MLCDALFEKILGGSFGGLLCIYIFASLPSFETFKGVLDSSAFTLLTGLEAACHTIHAS